MSETTVTIIVAVITALGSVITALIGWLARRGVNYLDQKTKILDEANKIQKKEAMKQRIIDVVTLVARSTMQTYVDELKEKSADGKLTKEEAREAFRRTFDKALSILKEDGIEVTRDMLTVIVEALEKNSLRGEKA
jgi:predicted RNA-binding protein associated with RNAse of E/G family